MHSGLHRPAPKKAVLASVAVACLATAGIANAGTVASEGPLHVPSPDWRDQVLYFLMIDRFDDGDPRNNDQRANEYDPADNAKFSGGDLAGVRRRVGYLHSLGATGVWITPPVANQWWNPRKHYGGYHGYWATDFKAIDAHFGTLDDYSALSRTLHGAGMVLVQDVVVNHTADFVGYDATRDPVDPAKGVQVVRDTQGQVAPAQAPFSHNDPRDPVQQREAIYHWTPDIVDFTDAKQLVDWQLAGLDDVNTENPVVRRALRDSYGYWIREAGVDGFRVDTAFHVPPAYFSDFLRADDAQAPGILRVADATGRKAFHVFGEGFAMDKPFEDVQARRIDAYMRAPDGTKLLPGMIDFPLYGIANAVFARGAPTAQLGDRIRRRMQVHADPWRMPTFLDNHDVDRFLAGGDEAGLKQALLMLMTLPGIPVIWQGTEQGFTEQRGAMFAKGFGSGGRDRFDTNAPLFSYLQRAIALRRNDHVFSRGTPTVLRDNAAGPGALAWRMRGEDGATALVAFNTATHPALLDGLETDLPPGTQLAGIFAIEGDAPPLVVDDRGRASLILPPRAGFAWKAGGVAQDGEVGLRPPTIAPLDAARVGGDFAVRGTATSRDPLRVVIDDDIDNAVVVRPDANGQWQARIPTAALVDPNVDHVIVAWEQTTRASERRTFRVARAWTPAANIDDPAGDDTGPSGRYTYPTGEGWQHQADIEHVDVSTAGGALKIAIRMRAITTPWNPPNGFDHVAFTIYIDSPGVKGGARVMPQQFANMPGDMTWDVRLRANGWSNALHSAKGASATVEGTPVTPAALVQLDAKARTVTFTVPANALGRAADLSGARVYVTTWDYDGGYRALAPEAGPHAFGGGDPARDPRVMDAVGPIDLP